MPPPPISEDVKKEIYRLGQQVPRLSNRSIAKALSVDHMTVSKYRDKLFVPTAPTVIEVISPALHEDIRKALKKQAHSAEELADILDCSPKKIREAIEAMKQRGAMLMQNAEGKYDFTPSFAAEPGRSEIAGTDEKWTHHFGFTTDNHLCNRHSRLDVLKAAYDYFESQGITTVYNAGNWIDGEARFNKTELVTAPGMDRQLDYLIDNWPLKPGITTHYIAGDDHEGWYQQREGVEIGRYLQMRAEEQGRHDLKYLGYGEADVSLKYGTGSAVMRLVHPGGGSAYAISYTDQKRVESYQGGEKPQIELVGHYHKFNVGYPREVWTAQGGCTCDQTMFMRKKRLQAHVGFMEIKLRQDAAGAITGTSFEWFPYFDRGYYEKRF